MSLFGRKIQSSASDPERGREEGKIPWLPILMYHRVVDERPENSDPYQLVISPADFEDQIRYLVEKGYQSIHLDDVPEAVKDGRPRWKKPVVITFDDGYLDTYTNAFPILRKYGVKATVMLVSNLIGSTNTWDREWAETVPLLTLNEIKEMSRHGISFGSHGTNHKSLTDLSAEEAWEDISGSKAELEALLGDEVRTFAYPFGRSVPEHSDMAKEAGYLAACSIEKPQHSLFGLSRINAAAYPGNTLMWRMKVSGLHFRLRQNQTIRRLRGFLP